MIWGQIEQIILAPTTNRQSVQTFYFITFILIVSNNAVLLRRVR